MNKLNNLFVIALKVCKKKLVQDKVQFGHNSYRAFAFFDEPYFKFVQGYAYFHAPGITTPVSKSVYVCRCMHICVYICIYIPIFIYLLCI